MIELLIEDGVTPTLSLMVERLSDFTEPLATILADGLFSAQQQVVEGKGAAFGGAAWPAMSEVTIKKGRDPGTLEVETGGLLLSLSRGGAGNIFEIGPTEGSAGTGLESARTGFAYPAWQQRGTSHYPGRPFVAWYAERFPAYDKTLEDWILGREAA